MTKTQLRRVVPWALTAAILAVGTTAAVEIGASGGHASAVSQVGPSSPPATSPSPVASSQPRSAAAKLAPKGTAPATVAPRASAASTATAVSLPSLSQTHPNYPPTQTLVDKKDGLIVAVYTVQRGDYLSEISARFQTPLNAVYVWSKDTVGPNANLIYAGQQIVVKVLRKL